MGLRRRGSARGAMACGRVLRTPNPRRSRRCKITFKPAATRLTISLFFLGPPRLSWGRTHACAAHACGGSGSSGQEGCAFPALPRTRSQRQATLNSGAPAYELDESSIECAKPSFQNARPQMRHPPWRPRSRPRKWHRQKKRVHAPPSQRQAQPKRAAPGAQLRTSGPPITHAMYKMQQRHA